MSQRLVMNYRHSSVGQRFTPSPCQEGRRIAGSLDLEEAALGFPVPMAGSPQHSCRQRQEEHDRRGLKHPKYSPALERDHPGGPHPSCCLCSIRREVSSTQWLPARGDAKLPSAKGHILQLHSAIRFWHVPGMVFETKIWDASIIAVHRTNSHFRNKEFANLLGTGYVRGCILYFYSLSCNALLVCSVYPERRLYTYKSWQCSLEEGTLDLTYSVPHFGDRPLP